MASLKDAFARVSPDWKEKLLPLFKSDLYKDGISKLQAELTKEEEEYVIFPPSHLYFEALRITPYSKVKVVILGQDPYIHPDQAMGLAFSVPDGMFYPPSLRNMFTELETGMGITRDTGDLTHWAQQGVLLLNICLSVRQGNIFSHKHLDWPTNITGPIITSLNLHPNPIIFALWGAEAIKFGDLVDTTKHTLLCCSHPSPMSVNKPVKTFPPFKGFNVFSKINAWLFEQERTLIEW